MHLAGGPSLTGAFDLHFFTQQLSHRDTQDARGLESSKLGSDLRFCDLGRGGLFLKNATKAADSDKFHESLRLYVGRECGSQNLIDGTIMIVIASAPLCQEARGREIPGGLYHVITRRIAESQV